MSDNPQIKKLKSSKEMTEISYNKIDHPVYHASSQMLNDNAMLITLQHSEEGDNQKNGAANDEHTFEIACKTHTYDEIVVPQDITNDSSVKILTILSSNTVDASDHSIIMDNIYSDEFETGSSVKTLTILNPVQPHNSDGLQFVGNSESVGFSDDSLVIEQELGECEPNSQNSDAPERHTAGSLKRNNSTKSKPIKKTSKHIRIDLEKPPSEQLKRNPTGQTYAHKKNKDGKTKFSLDQKLYQKIPLPNENEENAEKVPEPTSVYDFYDEEEEKCKAEQAKRYKELQALKERTCMHCKEVFSDPMDVLRHKRKYHKTQKVLVSREELEPYLKLENRTHCPLCYKEVCPLGYKSVYVKHLMIHCQDPGFTCRVCGIKFKRRDHLQSHEKRHVVAPENVLDIKDK